MVVLEEHLVLDIDGIDGSWLVNKFIFSDQLDGKEFAAGREITQKDFAESTITEEVSHMEIRQSLSVTAPTTGLSH